MTYTKIQGLFIVLIILIDSIWIRLSSFSFHYNRDELIIYALMLFLFLGLYFVCKNMDPQPKFIIAIQSTLLFFLCCQVMLVLSYLAYTTNLPLVNSTLASLDSSLGFNAKTLFLWFQAHPWWDRIFTVIYKTHLAQPFFIIIYFSFFGNPIYLQRFIMLFMMSLPLTIFIGSLCPAVGTYGWDYYPASEPQAKLLHHFFELRQNILNIKESYGIVTFPSFHTTLALMFAYTFRHEPRFIFIPILLLNILMVFSCLSQGGHYLVDILGGIAIFAVVAKGEQLLFYKVYARSKNKETNKVKASAYG